MKRRFVLFFISTVCSGLVFFSLTLTNAILKKQSLPTVMDLFLSLTTGGLIVSLLSLSFIHVYLVYKLLLGQQFWYSPVKITVLLTIFTIIISNLSLLFEAPPALIPYFIAPLGVWVGAFVLKKYVSRH